MECSNLSRCSTVAGHVPNTRKLVKKSLFFVHKLCVRLGLYIVPATYYAPNANVLELEKTRHLWAKKSELPGLAIDIDRQLTNLRAFCSPWISELADHAIYWAATAMHLGPGYGEQNLITTYCVLRTVKPSRVIEVGSGVSTYGTLAALKRNEAETMTPASLTAIEPFPTAQLRSLAGVSLIESPVQSVPMDVFLELERDDFLFIDSSHTVKPGGDVNFLILEVLPRLRPGVIVHFDDIHLPYDHGPTALKNYYHWSETSLLRAFLIHNQRAEIILSLRMLYCERLKALINLFPDFEAGEMTEQGLYPDRFGPFDYPPGNRPGAMFIRIL
jgi:Methyltransferase domain